MSEERCNELFAAMVDSVGVKAFAVNMHLSTRQIHRMLSGAQPNPVARVGDALAACGCPPADETLDYLCRRRGGYFVRLSCDLGSANVNAVKECAEAIIAISEGRPPKVTVKEIREAIAALAALEQRLKSPPGRA